MMASTTPNPYSNDGDEEQDKPVAESQSRWEKGVEFALARWLQALHIGRWAYPTIDDIVAPEAACREALGRELKAQIQQLAMQPRYIALGGNAESALGDAIAGADHLLLIECKATLSLDERAREAYGKDVKVKSNKTGKSIANPGGKDRLALFQALARASPVFRTIGEQCHIIVGMHAFQDAAMPAANLGPSDDNGSELAFSSYWPFIIGPDGADHGGTIDARPIAEIDALATSLPAFYFYVCGLLQSESQSDGDQDWLEREIILLAGRSAGAAVAWTGGRMSVSQLRLILQKNPNHVAALSKLKKAFDAAQAAAKLANPPKKTL